MTLDKTKVKKVLIVIGGPTAVGKTSLAIKVAQYFDTEVISADSRQFYRELNIGTAKPSKAELNLVKHHFINSLSIFDQYDVGCYERDALTKLNDIFRNTNTAVMVGGSGLFIKAVCDGLDHIPKANAEFREKLNNLYKEEGISALQEQVKELDPTYYSQVDQKNPARLIRALEVIASSGQTYSSFRVQNAVIRDFDTIFIALNVNREVLYKRIDDRMDHMIKEGLFEEAERLIDHEQLNPLRTVGYREVFGYLRAEYDRQEAIRLLKRNSRRYAKRQLTWFRKDDRYEWFDPIHYDQMLTFIKAKI